MGIRLNGDIENRARDEFRAGWELGIQKNVYNDYQRKTLNIELGLNTELAGNWVFTEFIEKEDIEYRAKPEYRAAWELGIQTICRIWSIKWRH